jgi:hypothetical protein
MLYQLSYVRTPADSSAQVWRAPGVFSSMGNHRREDRLSALWGRPKSAKSR